MYYSILVILPNVVVYKDVLDRLVKGVDPQRLPPTNGEGISSPPGRETHREQMWKMTYAGIQDQIIDDFRLVIHTNQSDPESPPGPGLRSDTGTGLVLHHESTPGLQRGSGRFLSCCSGSCPQSYSHLTEPRATKSGWERATRRKERKAKRQAWPNTTVIFNLTYFDITHASKSGISFRTTMTHGWIKNKKSL